MPAADEPFDALVRRVDEDRWLASRFAPASVRVQLSRLYVLVYEIARTAEQVRDPRLGDIRLQFWRDAIAEAFAGGAGHGVLAGLEQLRGEAAEAPLQALIDARGKDLDEAPFATWDDLDAYLDGTAGAVLRLGLQICAPDFARSAAGGLLVRAGGRAWGMTGLTRVLALWSDRRRTFLPATVRASFNLELPELFAGKAPQAQDALRAMRARAKALYREAKAVDAPQEAFPAFGYLALLPLLLKADPGARVALWRRQVQIVLAAASGRI